MIRVEQVSCQEQLATIYNLGIATPEFAAGDTVIFWPLESLKSWHAKSGGPMLVALDENSEIAGYILGTYHSSGIATIENLQVLSHQRGTGIGHRLIDAVDLHAKRAGMKAVRTLFKTGNVPIASLFSKHGYRPGESTVWFSSTVESSTPPRRIGQYCGMVSKRITLNDTDAALSLISKSRMFPWGLKNFFDFSRWITDGDSCSIGAFDGSALIGVGLASIHIPTKKSTIEVLCCESHRDRDEIELSVAKALMSEIRKLQIYYISAHPDEHLINKISWLPTVGFVQKKMFIPYVKYLEGSASL